MNWHGACDCVIGSPPFAGVEPCQDKSFWLNDGRTCDLRNDVADMIRRAEEEHANF